MCRHLGPVAAPLHRAPAPGARSRRVDKGDRAVDAFAAPDSGRELARDNLDQVAGDRREECADLGRGLPRSLAVRLESRHQAGRCRERVERRTIRGPHGPAVDHRLGGIPDSCPQALRLRDARGGCSDPDRTENVSRPSLQIYRLVQRLEPLAVGRVTRDRERKGQAAWVEPKDLAVGMMESEDAAVQHLTIIIGYSGVAFDVKPGAQQTFGDRLVIRSSDVPGAESRSASRDVIARQGHRPARRQLDSSRREFWPALSGTRSGEPALVTGRIGPDRGEIIVEESMQLERHARP
jgi:hypothetical protein